MEKREFRAEFKLIGEQAEAGTFEGLAAVFGNLDRQNEVIRPGAFSKTLEAFILHGFLANAHDWSEPVGTITEAYETPSGLFVKGDFHSTPRAQATRLVVHERLARGKPVAMSIGFNPKAWAPLKGGEGRELTEIELYEVSVVTVPANPLAHVASVKSEIDESDTEACAIQMRRIYLNYLAAAS